MVFAADEFQTLWSIDQSVNDKWRRPIGRHQMQYPPGRVIAPCVGVANRKEKSTLRIRFTSANAAEICVPSVRTHMVIGQQSFPLSVCRLIRQLESILEN